MRSSSSLFMLVILGLTLLGCSQDEPNGENGTGGPGPESAHRNGAEAESPAPTGALEIGLPLHEVAIHCHERSPIDWCAFSGGMEGVIQGVLTDLRFRYDEGCRSVSVPVLELVLSQGVNLSGTAPMSSSGEVVVRISSEQYSQWAPLPYRQNNASEVFWAFNDRNPAVALAPGMELVVPYLDHNDNGVDLGNLPLFWLKDGQVVQQPSPCGFVVNGTEWPSEIQLLFDRSNDLSIDEFLSATSQCEPSVEASKRAEHVRQHQIDFGLNQPSCTDGISDAAETTQ